MTIKESVELISFINLKVVANPNQINDVIPHTWIDMGYGYAECVPAII